MFIDQRAQVRFDVVGRVVHVLTRDDPGHTRAETDKQNPQHFAVQVRRVGLDPGDRVIEHVRNERLEDQTDEGETNRGEERQAM